ncbi:BrxA family protein [Patescibacteria group bacterium]
MMSYGASITGNPLMYDETRIVVKCRKNYKEKSELIKFISSNNLFKYKTNKSIPKRVSTIFKRINDLDEEILAYLKINNGDESRLIVLFSIYLTNTIVYDFINEFLSKKILTGDMNVNKLEVDAFLDDKKKELQVMNKWTDATISKISVILRKILKEANILTSKNIIKIPIYNHKFINLLEQNNKGRLFVSKLTKI